MDEFLKNISVNDLEKLRVLFSMMRVDDVKQVVTLRVFVAEYLSFIKNNRSVSYYESIELSFNHLISFFNIQKTISSISLKDIESFLTYLQQKVKKGHFVYYRNLKAAFNKAKEWGYLSENFFTKVKLPKRQKLAPAFINSEQLIVISKLLKNEVVRDVVVFAFYTGMRLDEIVNLRWKNVDLENLVITVGDENFITKGRAQRFIPISEDLTSILSSVLKQDRRQERRKIQGLIIPLGSARDFVFCKKDGKKFTGNYISQKFKRACTLAGIDKSIHFHSLRHSFASDLVQKGVPLYTIKELLGHSSVSTTEIYSHLNMDVLREAIEKLDTSTTSSTGSELRLGTGLRITKDESNKPTPFVPLQGGEVKPLQIFRINTGAIK